MISYDKYQNRIKRLAAVKNFIVRFRALFIALFAVLIAASLALMFTKGMITQNIVLPDRIVYGDDYADGIKAPKAFLSGVKYEFKRVNEESSAKSAVKYSLTEGREEQKEEEWTDELPTYAGKYLVRTVTKKITGKSYGTPKEFEIETKPVEFVIKSDSIVYSDMPKDYDFNPVKGDSLDRDSVRFNYEDPAADSTIVWADAGSFRIYNSKGEDVTFCYNISAPKTEKEITILPKNETLTPKSFVTEYIGAEIDYENGVYPLKGGDAHFTTKITDKNGTVLSGNPVNAGYYTVEIIPEETKVFYGDIDVTHHYNINYVNSLITVNRRPIIVTTNSATREYDGTPLIDETVTAEGLISGHTDKVKFGENNVNVGRYTNRCEYSIFDRDGEDVTANYAITPNFGTLEITRRVVKLTTRDYSKVYDGTSYFAIDSSSYVLEKDGGDALVSGHTPNHAFNLYYFDVGSYPNEIFISISDGIGDVTYNYDIQNNFGTLTISSRKILVTTPSGNWTYDGTAHKNDRITSADIVLLSDVGSDKNPLAGYENLVVEDSTKITYFTTDEVKNEFSCKIYKYGYETTKNYDIGFVNGLLTITPLPITIENQPYTRAYNGTYLSGSELLDTDAAPIVKWKVDRDVLVVDYDSTIIDVGEVYNKTTYKIVNSDGKDISTSYQISYKGDAKLTIEQASLLIITANVSKVYDGTELRGDDEIYGKPSFFGKATSDGYRAISTNSLTEFGSTPNKTEYEFFAVRDGVEVSTTGNYRLVDRIERWIEITKRPVRVVTEDANKEYDGGILKWHKGSEDKSYFNSTEGGLLSNHELAVDDTRAAAFITDVGTTPNEVYFKVLSGGRDVTENYNLEDYYKFGTLEVTPRIVRVTTATQKWIYNASEHSDNSKDCAHGRGTDASDFVKDEEEPFILELGHKLELISPKITVVGECDNISEYYTLTDKNNKNVLSNYKLIWVYGKFTVNKRPIKITTDDGYRVYDDSPFFHISGKIEEYVAGGEERGLLSEHTAIHDTAQKTASVTYVTQGKVENELHYKIYGSSGDVTANYDIEYTYGTIYVTKLPITITTKSSSAEFDGLEYFDADTNPDNVVTYGKLLNNHYLKAVSYPVVTYVTQGDISNKVVYHIEKNGVDLTGNYDVSYVYGYISRTVRYVRITSNDATWTYDGEWHTETGYSHVHLKNGVSDGTAGLVLGHELEAVTFARIKEFKENAANNNVVSYRFKDDSVKGNYDLQVTCGTITIKQRPIIIITADKSERYDGTPFSWTKDWIVEGGEVDGKKLEKGLVTSDHELKALEITSITDVQRDVNGNVISVPNVVTYMVVHKNGIDEVNSNYNITGYRNGQLRLDPRPVKITTGSKSEVYNGKALEWSEYDCETCNTVLKSGLLTDLLHYAELDKDKPTAKITYITVGENGLEDSTPNERYYLIKVGGKDISGNYEIEYIYGTLKILPRPLTITTKTLSQSYNGNWLYGEVVDGPATLAKFDDLVQTEICYGVNIAKIIDYVELGIENDTEYRIFTSDGRVETTCCYEIAYEYGTLKINRISLEITSLSRTKIYDGDPLMGDDEIHSADDESYIAPVFTGIIQGEFYESKVGYITKITDYGSVKNETQYEIYALRDGIKVKTTSNYVNFIYKPGTLKIEKRPIRIETEDATKEYDGTELTCPRGRVISDLGLVKDHMLKDVEIIGTITDVKWVDGKISGEQNIVRFIVVDKDGNDKVNENYEIIGYTYGTLTVTPRIIRVTTADGRWTYDADWHSNPSETCEHGSLTAEGKFVPDEEDRRTFVLKHSLVRLLECKIKDAGKCQNVYDYDVIDINGSVKSNYYLVIVYGELIIDPRPITITTGSDKMEYNGGLLECKDFTFEELNELDERGLLTDHNVLPADEKYVNITNVYYDEDGNVSFVLNIFAVKILGKGGELVTQNYDINYDYGTLTITPRIIRIKTASDKWTYDGNEKSAPDEVCTHGSLTVDGKFIPDEEDTVTVVSGQTLVRTYWRVEIDAGVYENFCDYDIFNATNNSMLSNYYLIREYGELVIGKRYITIINPTLDKIYDGEPLRGDEESPEISADQGIVEGENLKAAFISEITDYGWVWNNTRYEIFAKRNGQEVRTTDNYSIGYLAGKLTVEKRTIWVLTADYTREYDGTALIWTDDWTITGKLGLVGEHTLKPVEIIGRITDVKRLNGEIVGVDNVVRYIVVDGEDETVNDNYIIEYFNKDGEEAYGTLTVNPRQITVKTATDEKEYDGTALTNTKDAVLTYGSLVTELNHYLYVEDWVEVPSVTEVYEGSIPNKIRNYWVYDPYGDVSYNYDISYDEDCGTLTIIPRKVSIVLAPIENIVYGNEFTGYPAGDADYDYEENSNHIVDGETLKITVKYQFNDEDIDVTKSILYVGTYYVVLDGTYIENGRLDNYDISISYARGGMFEVTRRQITINLIGQGNGGKVYDGLEFAFEGGLNVGYTIVDGNTVYNDEITIAVKYLLNGSDIGGNPLNAGNYVITLDESQCNVFGDRELALNYEIICDTLDYIISPCPLKFNIKTLTHEYMGEYNYNLGADAITLHEDIRIPEIDRFITAYGSTLSDGEVFEAIEVGEYVYGVIGFRIVRRTGGADATQNYCISDEQTTSTLTIEKRQIRVSVEFEVTASRERTGNEIDLVSEYPDFGPYSSKAANANVGGYGFYEPDREKITAKFSAIKGGVPAKLIELGKYTVSVAFEDKEGFEILKNYDIVSYSAGDFEITRRQIIVTPTKSFNTLTYDRTAFNKDLFSYDTTHFFTGGTGFLDDEADRAQYEIIYKLTSKLDGTLDVDSTEPLQAGEYNLEITLKFLGEDGEQQYDIVQYVNPLAFTVLQRNVYANTPDDNTKYVYNKKAANKPAEYKMFYQDGVWKEVDGGYVAYDFKDAEPVYEYYKGSTRTYSAVDAGEYTIKITGYTAPNIAYINRNYYVIKDITESGMFAHGKLTIKPATVVIVPVGYSVDYDGTVEEISLPSGNYDILYVEGNGNRLFGGALSFTASGSVNIRMSNLTRVFFVDVRIRENGVDVSSNYDLVYSYGDFLDRFPDTEKLPDSLKDVGPLSFSATLSFNQIVLHVTQPQAPKDYRQIVYGSYVTIPVANPDITGNVSSGKLLSGHRIEIAATTIVAYNTDWIDKWIQRCIVLDSENNEITMGYKIIIDCGTDSRIHVIKSTLRIRIDISLDGLENGHKIEEGNYTILEGELYFGEIIEITVRDGLCVAKITNPLEVSRDDGYEVIFEYYQSKNNLKEAEYASRIQLLLSRRVENVEKDIISE